jgi:hypothetical protein
MASASWAQTSFLGGEWSKSAQGRFDDPMYRKAMNVCLNTLPIVEGSTTRRPGFRVGATTRMGLPAKLLPYTENTVDMELELTEGHARFFLDGKIFTNAFQAVTNISAANPGVITLSAAVTWPDQSQVVFQFLDQTAAAAVPRLANRTFLLDLITTSTFALRDAVSGMQVDCTSLGWVAGLNLQASLVADVVTPYTAGAWANMNIIQSDKRALLVGPNQQPEVIMSTGITPPRFTDGPYLDPFPNSYITPDNLNGVVNLVLSFAAYDSTKAYALGDYVTSSTIGYVSIQAINQGNTPASSPTFWQVVLPSVIINNGGGFGAGDANRMVRLFSEPPFWDINTNYSAGNVVTLEVDNTYWVALTTVTHAAAASGGVSPAQPGVLAANWAPASGVALWTWGEITANSVTSAIPGIIDPTSGTNFGNMTNYGGLAAAFDGNTGQTETQSAYYPGYTGYVGKAYAVAQQIGFARAYPPTDGGFTRASSGYTVTLNLRGKHTAPASSSDGTLLGSTGSIPDTFSPITILSTDQVTAWEYVWFEVIGTYAQTAVAEAQFYSTTSSAGAGIAVQIIGPPLLYTSTIRTWRLGLFGGPDQTWPTCGCYHEGRFWLSGAVEGRFDGSVSNGATTVGNIGQTETVLDFSPTDDTGAVLDDSAISYTLNAKEAGQFVWMKPDLQGILVGTEKTELLIHASDNTNIITPTSIQAHPTTEYGTTDTTPVAAPLSSVFIHKSGKQIFEYFIAAYTRRPVGLEISTMSRHLTADTVKELAYTSRLNPTIWYRTAKEALRAITYRRTDLMANSPPDFSAAHQHAHGNNAGIIGVCQARSVSGDKTDTLAIVAQDPITGVCTVEYMTDLPGEDLDVFHAQYLDGAVIPTAVTSITGGIRFSGLHIYNGKTVTVYAAGLDLGDHIVASSVVDVLWGADPDGILSQRYLTELQGLQQDYGDLGVALDNGASIPALVGFTYTSQGQVLRPIAPDATGSQSGPALGKLRRQATWSALFLNTRGLSIGTTFDKVRTILFKRNNNANLSPIELFSGAMYGNLDDATTLDSMLCWETTRPSPANIIAVGGFITSDK